MIKTVLEMLQENMLYCIPSYQRGYRWSEREITALLEDLAEFAELDCMQNTYLLQPIAIRTDKPTGAPDGFAEYKIVVDGQQRLTTLSIILSELVPGHTVSHFWDVTNHIYLDDPELRGLNNDFRLNARETIADWKIGHPEKANRVADVLNGHYGNKRVIFIEYELSESDDEHETFIRLNAGKIPLTSAELIRAQLMTSPLSTEKRMEIAKEWELFEKFLREPQTWSMIAGNRNPDAYGVRMNIIFEAVSSVRDSAIPLKVYQHIEPAIRKDPGGYWKNLLRFYYFLKSCRLNHELCNLMSFLAHLGKLNLADIFKTFLASGDGVDYGAFKKYLREKIADIFQDTPEFSAFGYGTPLLREFLLLLNILFCNTRKQYFDFVAYSGERWDIEHIDSRTENELHNPEDRLGWLKLAYQEDPVLEAECEKLPTFEEKRRYIADHFNDKLLQNKDGIGNLVMLNANINRGYKNAIFPVKRRWIRNAATGERPRFVPPCTIAAFMKFFTDGAYRNDRWNDKDATSFANAMEKLYNDFISEES